VAELLTKSFSSVLKIFSVKAKDIDLLKSFLSKEPMKSYYQKLIKNDLKKEKGFVIRNEGA